MTYVAATANKIPSGHGVSFSAAIALVVAALALASGVTAWITDPATWAWVALLASEGAAVRAEPESNKTEVTTNQPKHLLFFIKSCPLY